MSIIVRKHCEKTYFDFCYKIYIYPIRKKMFKKYL